MSGRAYTASDICLGSVPAMQGSEDWRIVACIISDVSEECYAAGWMQHAEYDVWRLMIEGGSWGQRNASEVGEELGALRSLSQRFDVWVTWCDEHGEEPMRLDDWQRVYGQWRRQVHDRHLAQGRVDPHQYDDGEYARPGDLCVWCLAPKTD